MSRDEMRVFQRYRQQLPAAVRKAIAAGHIGPVLKLCRKYGYTEFDDPPMRDWPPLNKLAAVHKVALTLPECADLAAASREWLAAHGFRAEGLS